MGEECFIDNNFRKDKRSNAMKYVSFIYKIFIHTVKSSHVVMTISLFCA